MAEIWAGGAGQPNSPAQKKIYVPTKGRKDKIEAELKLLEWHKLANNAALKAAIMQTKSIMAEAPKKNPARSSEDSRWIKRVIDEEQVKPLEVTRDFVLEYERRERENAERLTNQVELHINTLKKLRDKLENHQTTKARAQEYRSWKQQFEPVKNAVLAGRTVDDAARELITPGSGRKSSSKSPNRTNQSPGSRNRSHRDGTAGGGDVDADGAYAYGEFGKEEATGRAKASSPQKTKPKGGIAGGKQELADVLDSLNKLADLEKRITNLEDDNAYDFLLEKEKVPVNERTAFEFRKKRTENAAGGSLGVKYSMKPKKSAWGGASGGGGGGFAAAGGGANQRKSYGVGNGIDAVRAKRGGVAGGNNNYGGYGAAARKGGAPNNRGGGPAASGGGGVFLTGMEDVGERGMDEFEEERELVRRERRRLQELAPAGQKNLRARVQTKKARVKEQVIGQRKHEEALKELNRRRIEQQRRPPMNIGGGGGRGRAILVVQAPVRGAASGMRTKNKHLQEFEKMKSGFKKRKDDVIVPGGPQRHTIPVAAAVGPRRVPATQIGGTVTRRTQAPVRRRGPSDNGAAAGVLDGLDDDVYAGYGGGGGVVVSGVGGLRALKGQNMGKR